MRAAHTMLMLLLFSSMAAAFSIDDYQNNVKVNTDGSISVYEKITFDLDQQYNEGFRSIRKEDFSVLTDIKVGGVLVNGETVPFGLQRSGDQAEIVWEKTFVGKNVVELEYTIANRVFLYNDFAQLCYEHFGANWQIPAANFSARTTLPSAAANKTMHFEIFSNKNGSANVDNLTIIANIADVPPGNYVGGCYLFDRESVFSRNIIDAFAYEILKTERELFGSNPILTPEKPYLEWICFPLFLLSGLLALGLYLREGGRPRLPETILPPDKEEPAVVTALVRNNYDTKELTAATIIDLINRGVVDIVELEKSGPKTAEMKKERTILMLKKKPADLRDYEKSVIDFVFGDKLEVDLDAEMERYSSIKNKEDASVEFIVKRVDKFKEEFPGMIKNRLSRNFEMSALSDSAPKRKVTSLVSVVIALMFLAFFFLGSLVSGGIEWYIQHREYARLEVIVISTVLFFGCTTYAIFVHLKPRIPENRVNRHIYSRWDAFYRGLKSSRIKHYPPASAVIWGEILVYATALGLADKVKSHLSELSVLDPKIAGRMDSMNRVSIVTMNYYGSAIALSNLSAFGNRSGAVSSGDTGRHGGFSSFSSGGWSSGGGGGFSGGSSGGGGFR